MQEVKDVKRLYIGGLSHTISQKDIKDRFGKFGEVSDVEIVTRQDLTGKTNSLLPALLQTLCTKLCCLLILMVFPRCPTEDVWLYQHKHF